MRGGARGPGGRGRAGCTTRGTWPSGVARRPRPAHRDAFYSQVDTLDSRQKSVNSGKVFGFAVQCSQLWRGTLTPGGRQAAPPCAGVSTRVILNRTKPPFLSPLICTTVALDSGEIPCKSRRLKEGIWSFFESW